MQQSAPVICILGASGLIGNFLAEQLAQRGLSVVPVARRFTRAQKAGFEGSCIETPIVDLGVAAIAQLLAVHNIDIVVNCLGVLQDGAHGGADNVHRGFAERLLAALAAQVKPVLLVQISIPGNEADDITPFSRTKRKAEHLIAACGLPHVILRPGFVVAPAAYGGSAIVRALAALPFGLPGDLAKRPFATTDVHDIAATIEFTARHWQSGERNWAATWDVMEREASTLGGVVDAFRRRFGGPAALLQMPAFMMGAGGALGDLCGHLGWSPPLRTTAIAELRRGIDGDPSGWIAATGVEPSPIATSLARLPASVQEGWFARLYVMKAAIIVLLAAFWIASGLIALFPAFDAASAVLITHGFPRAAAHVVTWLTSLMDIAIGVCIALRRTCRFGLAAGAFVSLFYLGAASLITPELWIDPVGPLVKTAPAILLMLVALAILDDR